VDALAEIDALVGFRGRVAGTDAERRAAEHLARRLRSLGRAAETEPFWTWPRYAPAHLLHVGLGVIGSVVSVYRPLIGVAILLVALLSTLLDLSGRAFLARRLTPRRASQNVVSREDGRRPGTLVLVAHYDAARTGLLFTSGVLGRLGALGRRLRLPLGPAQVLVFLLLFTLACAAVRIALPLSYEVTIVQVVPTALLLVVGALLAGVTVSEVVPGANDNASGVATALRLAERHGGGLEHFDLWVLFSGADEGLLLGSSRFVRDHRRELDPRRTVFLGIDRVGAGTVRYARREGFLGRRRYYGPLLRLCEELGGEARARPIAPMTPSSAHAAARRGYPALSIMCAGPDELTPHYHLPSDSPDRLELESLEAAFRFCSDLIESIDGRIGPDLERLDATTEPAGKVPAPSATGGHTG
jgi:hypothetical protein